MGDFSVRVLLMTGQARKKKEPVKNIIDLSTRSVMVQPQAWFKVLKGSGVC